MIKADLLDLFQPFSMIRCQRHKLSRMKRIILASLVVFALITACKDDDVPSSCTTPATVKDYTGLDGCGYVFVLNDGKVLQPYFSTLCNILLPGQKDPFTDFEFKDGKKVIISYEIVEGVASACMAGDLVNITCLTDLGIIEEEK